MFVTHQHTQKQQIGHVVHVITCKWKQDARAWCWDSPIHTSFKKKSNQRALLSKTSIYISKPLLKSLWNPERRQNCQYFLKERIKSCSQLLVLLINLLGGANKTLKVKMTYASCKLAFQYVIYVFLCTCLKVSLKKASHQIPWKDLVDLKPLIYVKPETQLRN